jgi:virulence-associated protein VagC
MKLKVTKKGLLIPKELLGESQEVQVTQEQEEIIITTIKKVPSSWHLVTKNLETELKDGSIKHDHSEENQEHITKLSELLLLPELEENDPLFERNQDTGRDLTL